MAPNVLDRRVRRTRQLLQEAIVELILEKPFSRITVQDIIDGADVGRSTFYAHFTDKEALLVSIFDDLANDLDHHIEETAKSRHLLHTEAFFKHAQKRHDFYQAMVEGGSLEILLETGRRHIEASIQTHMRQMDVKEESLGVPLLVLTNFLTGSLLSLLTWWLEEDMPYHPSEIASMYERLVMPGFKRVLDMNEQRYLEDWSDDDVEQQQQTPSREKSHSAGGAA